MPMLIAGVVILLLARKFGRVVDAAFNQANLEYDPSR